MTSAKRGCTQCGECVNVCPVFQQHKREEYSPKAKRLLLEPVEAGNKELPWEKVKNLARLCAGCGRCKQACARKLSTAELLADVRAAHPHWTQHLWELWIHRMGPLWLSIGRIASLVPDTVTPAALVSSLDAAKAMANDSAVAPWARLSRDPSMPAEAASVVLFSGCTARNVRPQWTEKAEQFLRAWGYTVCDASGFTCCGGTLHHAGQYTTMNAMRAQNVEHWKQLGKPRITAFCASCHHGLAEYAHSSLPNEDAALWKKNLIPLSALLKGAVATPTPALPSGYGYHQPCHWEKDMDMPFLSGLFPGMSKGNASCCGMGGILKMTDPDLSMHMAESCLKAFPPALEHILTGCSGCALQLSSVNKGVRISHWLDVVEA